MYMELERVKYINLKEFMHQFATIKSKKKNIIFKHGLLYLKLIAFILMTFINQIVIISWCH